jgi:hypothetical protein
MPTVAHREDRPGRGAAVLADHRRRRAAAVRMEGGDPEHPGTRFHRPSTGLRASGFREGFARGGQDALRRAWALIPEEYRAAIEGLACDYTDRSGS